MQKQTGYFLTDVQQTNALSQVVRYYQHRKNELGRVWKAEEEINLVLPEFILQGVIDLVEGELPSVDSKDESAIEEERRLAYVAITRAKKTLTITNSYSRMLFGSTNRNAPSRFLREVPKEFCDMLGYNSTVVTANNYYKPQNTTKSVSFKSSFSSTNINDSNNLYQVGQKIKHNTFGCGIIVKITPMGNDKMLEIEFESIGNKKIMSNFAKLTIL